MHVRFADRVTHDGVVRCTRCAHEVIVRRADAVPRCYCGGHEFEFLADAGRDRVPRAPGTPHARGDPPAASAEPAGDLELG